MAEHATRLSTPKIAVQAVAKSFGDFVALDRLDLNVAAGEFFVIVGPSGCGKTTLLRILGGLERQSSGEVVLAEVDPARPSNSIVFQGDSIFWMNVFDNASYGLPCADCLSATRAGNRAAVSREDGSLALSPALSAPTLGRHAPVRLDCARLRQ
jgi:ABC-type Fe3+/spermidine/putrescine transport system ATPase subunit